MYNWNVFNIENKITTYVNIRGKIQVKQRKTEGRK
jgi:hypothetical protein